MNAFFRAAGTALLLFVFASSSHARDIRLGSPWTTTSTPHVALVKFAEEVTRLSSGDLKILVFPDSQLGDIQALITGLQTGTVDMSLLAIGNAGVLKGGSALNVAYTPYLFKDKAAAERALNSQVFVDMYEQLAKESGVRIFAVYGSRSPRALHTTRGPVRTPADMKGMKIRIPPVEAIRLTVESWGGRPVVLGLGDTYMALSRGQVEGHEVGIDAATAFKWQEVAKYWSTTDHNFDVATWYITEKLWQSLTEAQRSILRQAAQTAGVAMSKATEELDLKAMDELRKAGVTITNPDIAAFREASKNVHLQLEGKAWPAGLVERIRAAQ